MRIKLVGLGKMGSNLALNLKDHGYEVIGYDANEQVRNQLKDDITIVDSFKELLKSDHKRRIIWLLIPSQIVDKVLEDMLPYLNENDIVIDGGNSNFNISIRRYHYLKSKHIDFVDLGTSGGIKGASHGLCLMAGGDKDVIEYLTPIFNKVSVENGFSHVGKPGAGHFAKMVHNGIEYGMMQAIAEGFDVLESSPYEFDLNQITNLWNHGSVIESKLLEHVGDAFKDNPKLSGIEGIIDDSGYGMWMIEEAMKLKVSMPVITQSLYARYKSRDENHFAEKVVAAMRKEFGGHAVYKKK
ncbi:MAG: decarboxylating 6-phosphogluconate dehydrogenase [Acholeplasmataceae bacterium]